MASKLTYQVPDEDIKRILKAAKEQHDKLRAAIETDVIMDSDNYSPEAKEFYRFLLNANTAIVAAMDVYDRLVDYTHLYAALEGWKQV